VHGARAPESPFPLVARPSAISTTRRRIVFAQAGGEARLSNERREGSVDGARDTTRDRGERTARRHATRQSLDMDQRQGESSSKLGLHYVRAREGVELPIIDVTHPAFVVNIDDEDLRLRVEQFMRTPQPLARLPAAIRSALLRALLRRSVLGGAVLRAAGSCLGALPTYVAKLGPENLPKEYASPLDRSIAAALPALTMRVRLQDIARLIAEVLRRHLDVADRSPLRLLNIAGGTAIDSISALLLLRGEGGLVGRRIDIEVLDRDGEGPPSVHGRSKCCAAQARRSTTSMRRSAMRRMTGTIRRAWPTSFVIEKR
jgi:hypothetical protein